MVVTVSALGWPRAVGAGLCRCCHRCEQVIYYDPNNPAYQRTAGFTMPEEFLPAFREAFERL
ncbi:MULTISPECIES: hypothetical protein [Streptomyces]|uniref:Uncharacterized protein n=1 Tax=Streptomyces ehimensis TaxID=68195 RepID=A0ABV9BTA7_9ACTN